MLALLHFLWKEKQKFSQWLENFPNNCLATVPLYCENFPNAIYANPDAKLEKIFTWSRQQSFLRLQDFRDGENFNLGRVRLQIYSLMALMNIQLVQHQWCLFVLYSKIVCSLLTGHGNIWYHLGSENIFKFGMSIKFVLNYLIFILVFLVTGVVWCTFSPNGTASKSTGCLSVTIFDHVPYIFYF